MEIRPLHELPSRALLEHGSAGTVTFVAGGSGTSVVRIELPLGGRVGLHPAARNQVLVVVSGAGEVRSGSEPPVAVRAGDVVSWRAGEEHETASSTGLVALVVEAPDLQLAG